MVLERRNFARLIVERVVNTIVLVCGGISKTYVTQNEFFSEAESLDRAYSPRFWPLVCWHEGFCQE